MAEETEKKVKNNDVDFLGFNVKDALTGNMERGHPKTLSNRNKSGFDEEFGKLLKKSILGG